MSVLQVFFICGRHILAERVINAVLAARGI